MQINSMGNNPERPYTMKSLKIAEGSIEASIFNQIDMEDSNKDDALTEQQYNKYKSLLNFFSNNAETNPPDTLVSKNPELENEILAGLTEEASPENPEESDVVTDEPEGAKAKPARRKKDPSKITAKPRQAKPKNVTKNSKDVEYNARQEKLIEDMKKTIDKIENSERDFSGCRKFNLDNAKKLLEDAKRNMLDKTEEYKQLTNLCKMEDFVRKTQPRR